jgi:hypothetical protein
LSIGFHLRLQLIFQSHDLGVGRFYLVRADLALVMDGG